MGFIDNFKEKQRQKNAKNWFELGVRTKDLKKKKDYFTKSLENDPTNVNAWRRKAEALWELGLTDEASSCYAKADEMEKTARTSSTIEAEKDMASKVEISPEDVHDSGPGEMVRSGDEMDNTSFEDTENTSFEDTDQFASEAVVIAEEEGHPLDVSDIVVEEDLLNPDEGDKVEISDDLDSMDSGDVFISEPVDRINDDVPHLVTGTDEDEEGMYVVSSDVVDEDEGIPVVFSDEGSGEDDLEPAFQSNLWNDDVPENTGGPDDDLFVPDQLMDSDVEKTDRSVTENSVSEVDTMEKKEPEFEDTKSVGPDQIPPGSVEPGMEGSTDADSTNVDSTNVDSTDADSTDADSIDADSIDADSIDADSIDADSIEEEHSVGSEQFIPPLAITDRSDKETTRDQESFDTIINTQDQRRTEESSEVISRKALSSVKMEIPMNEVLKFWLVGAVVIFIVMALINLLF